MNTQDLKKWLTKVAAARRRSWQFAYSKNPGVSLLDVQKVEFAVTYNKPERWCWDNATIIKRVCLPMFYKQWDEWVLPYLYQNSKTNKIIQL